MIEEESRSPQSAFPRTKSLIEENVSHSKIEVRKQNNEQIRKTVNKKNNWNSPNLLKELQENSYAISPEVSDYMITNKLVQKSQPLLSSKLPKNFIFKKQNKVKGKYLRARVYSAVRRSFNPANISMSLTPIEANKK